MAFKTFLKAEPQSTTCRGNNNCSLFREHVYPENYEGFSEVRNVFTTNKIVSPTPPPHPEAPGFVSIPRNRNSTKIQFSYEAQTTNI